MRALAPSECRDSLARFGVLLRRGLPAGPLNINSLRGSTAPEHRLLKDQRTNFGSRKDLSNYG
jgi:hypothetical protein